MDRRWIAGLLLLGGVGCAAPTRWEELPTCPGPSTELAASYRGTVVIVAEFSLPAAESDSE
jgi:hypothetical protein